MDIRGKWKTYPNENIRSLFIDVELWNSINVDVYKVPLTDDQQVLIEDLNGIYGVMEFGFDKFEIRVTKAEVFTWEEIAPKVESVVGTWRGGIVVLAT